MQIINKTGSNRVYIDRVNNRDISFPKNQPVEVDDTTGGILLKIDGFEIVKEEKKRKKEGSK